ncbi:translation initiation factor IF-2-like isoform X2 [Gallus gallus]|uniref:translation initiation factor IF-2-like isoform X2 n=1 Tax=Gallus gallus TaxID=9031 RepID=UPI001F0129AE|nr:translation initiation factor IF-2-like isoform X2 [Gallus gallus]
MPLPTAGNIPGWQGSGSGSASSRWGCGPGPCAVGSPRSPQAAARCRPPAAPAPPRSSEHLQCSCGCSPGPAPCPPAGSRRRGPLQMPWRTPRSSGTQRPPTCAPIPPRLRSAAAAQRWNQEVSLGAAQRAAGCPHRVAVGKLALPHWGCSCFSSSDNELRRPGGHQRHPLPPDLDQQRSDESSRGPPAQQRPAVEAARAGRVPSARPHHHRARAAHWQHPGPKEEAAAGPGCSRSETPALGEAGWAQHKRERPQKPCLEPWAPRRPPRHTQSSGSAPGAPAPAPALPLQTWAVHHHHRAL